MKLRNKKTSEIVEFRYLQSDHVAPLVLTTYENDKPEMYTYNSLAELNAEWEDYVEPKEYWYIDTTEGSIVEHTSEQFELTDKERKEIGNYFETKEEAEKAVEKLKAWKRLKENGFKFKRWEIIDGRIDFMILPKVEYREKVYEDLDLLFGGEE